MVVYAGQNDPAWSMSRLWRSAPAERSRPAPGPKPGLSLEVIVAAAIDVADRDGLVGLSMKAVGQRLGRTAMALYTYVPGKNELIDLMHDAVHAELPDDYDLGAGWRAATTTWARQLLAFHLRHPWTLQVSYARPVLGPYEQNVVETLTRILRESGLPARTIRRVSGVLLHFVRGTAQTIAEARLAAAETGTSDQEWWSARSAQLAAVAPDFATRFPALTWLASQEQAEGATRPADAAGGSAVDGAGAPVVDGVDPQVGAGAPVVDGVDPQVGAGAPVVDGVDPQVGAADDSAIDARPYLEHETAEMFATGLAVLLDGIEVTIGRSE
ncbi:TetR/AcrR family transcriptional regulator C-terminal domain-containing protein [Micromonospora polyrhachis]|nr:TetR/AcrR family transcriptional regulator C-terminal domain-containing protein [Micromonospora polyrhachis]